MPLPRCSSRAACAMTALGTMTLLLVPATAAAQVTIHGTGSISVGYTDNVEGAPSDPKPGDPEKVGDMLVTMIPGLLLTYRTPTIGFFALYQHPANFYMTHPGAQISGDE